MCLKRMLLAAGTTDSEEGVATLPQLPPGHLGAGYCCPPWLPHQLCAWRVDKLPCECRGSWSGGEQLTPSAPSQNSSWGQRGRLSSSCCLGWGMQKGLRMKSLFRWWRCLAWGRGLSLKLTGHPSCSVSSVNLYLLPEAARPPSSSMRTWCTSSWALLVRLSLLQSLSSTHSSLPSLSLTWV